MKNIKILGGSYQVSFSMKNRRNGRSRTISAGTYKSIKDAINIRDFILKLKDSKKVLIRYDTLKLVNERRKSMGYYPIRNSLEFKKL